MQENFSTANKVNLGCYNVASLSDNVAKRPRCQISSMSTLSHSMNREYMRENMAKYTKIKLSSNTYCNNRTKWQQMESKDIE